MKTKIILTFLFLIFCLSHTRAVESRVQFNIAPAFKTSFGNTDYVMEVLGYTDTVGTIGTLKSQLEFPLDIFWAGIEFEAFTLKSDKKDWITQIAFYRHLSDPRRVMKDHDWITPLGGSEFKWSYTESAVTMKATDFTIKLEKRIYSWPAMNTFILIGYKYQQLEQEIINYKGWQYDLSDIGSGPIYGGLDIHALYYRTIYSAPIFGIMYNFEFGTSSNLDIATAAMLVFADDYDLHLLRYKVSRGDGIGYGLYSEFEIDYLFKSNASKHNIFIQLGGEFVYLKTNGDQTQEWYGNDPLFDGDETGSVITNIPHDFNSLQLNIGLKVGLYF